MVMVMVMVIVVVMIANTVMGIVVGMASIVAHGYGHDPTLTRLS